MASQLRRSLDVMPFYRNVRVLAVLAQSVFALGIVALGWLLLSTMWGNLHRQGIPISFAFFSQPAGFGISEGLAFHPSQSYLTAFGVGVVGAGWLLFTFPAGVSLPSRFPLIASTPPNTATPTVIPASVISHHRSF